MSIKDVSASEIAEADESFRDMIAFFWKEKGDPTRYSGWDADRCQRLMPQFFEAWSKCELYRGIADTTAEAGR